MIDFNYDKKHGLKLYSDVNLDNLIFDTTTDNEYVPGLAGIRLIPTQRLYFGIPEIKTDYLEIPGRDGKIDLSTVIAKRPVYNNITGSFTFVVANYAGAANEDQRWIMTLNRLLSLIHGKYFYLVLTDDPDYSHYGKIFLSDWSSPNDGSNLNTITFNYDIEPFKVKKELERIYPYAYDSANNIYQFSSLDGSFSYPFINGLYNTTLEVAAAWTERTYPFQFWFSNDELEIPMKKLDSIDITPGIIYKIKNFIISNRNPNNLVLFKLNQTVGTLKYYYRGRYL